MAHSTPVKTRRKKKTVNSVGSDTYTEGLQPHPHLRPKNNILYETFTDDWADLVCEYTRLREISISRWIFRNVPPITGAILDIGNYAVGNAWRPVFLGKDQAWGKQAKAWLENWFKIGNVCGNGFDLWDDLKIASYDLDVKGDILLVLTYAKDGKYPMWQWIPAEQILNRNGQTTITKGPFTGYAVEHGVVHNGVRGIGYQVIGETVEDDVVISEENAFLLFEPRDARQMRGEPSLVASLNTVRDYRVWIDNERNKQKILSSQVMAIENTAGEDNSDPSAEIAEASATAGGADGVYGKYIRGSSIQIFKAGAGEKITPIEHSNPATNTQDFITDHVLRSAFSALEWPVEMFNIQALRNGPVRFIKEKVMAKVLKRQETLSAPYLRLVYYGISKAIKLGLLPKNKDFLNWGYQLPAEITIDSGRDSAASLNEIEKYAKTYRTHYGEKGADWREEMDQRAYEELYKDIAKQKAREALNDETGIEVVTTREVITTGGVHLSETEETMLKDKLEAYGVAVRAGAITPSIADEEAFRKEMGLPPVDDKVRAVWTEENHSRRPITLKGGLAQSSPEEENVEE